MISHNTLQHQKSNLPWIGLIPSDWQIVPLLSVVQERNDKNVGMLESNLLSLSYGRIVRKDMSSNDGLLPESFETYQIVHPGDIVFRLTDLQNDKRSLRTALVEEQGIITSAYLAVVPRGARPDYLNYLFRSYDISKVFYSMGGGLRQSMKFADLKRLPVLLPPVPEQAAIAAFLDRETAKIDQLVEEQKRLIDLLTDKRQAVISHAVTKGLNPNAPMKDSGIEWLGEVPEHWGVTRLKRVAELIDGDRSSAYPSGDDIVDEGIPFLSSRNIVKYKFHDRNLQFITAEKFKALSRGKIQHGDLGITVRGTIGHVAIFDSEVIGYPSGFINAQMMIIRPRNISSEFLHSVTESRYWREQLDAAAYGTAQQQLSNGVLKEIHVALPPLTERNQIEKYLSSRNAIFDGLIHEAEQSLALLQERRAALISAAVSGKIEPRTPGQIEDAA